MRIPFCIPYLTAQLTIRHTYSGAQSNLYFIHTLAFVNGENDILMWFNVLQVFGLIISCVSPAIILVANQKEFYKARLRSSIPDGFPFAQYIPGS